MTHIYPACITCISFIKLNKISESFVGRSSKKAKSTNVRILGARVNQFHSIGVLRTCLLFLQHISVSCADSDQSIDILVGGWPTPLKNMKVSSNIWENNPAMFQTTNQSYVQWKNTNKSRCPLVAHLPNKHEQVQGQQRHNQWGHPDAWWDHLHL